ncbi:TPA: lpg0045 family Dot/Icm T4SS effector, partial [Legionella pneumophila subsp. pneumophila]|nr:lpg0045 family Dot/Icm T4SS effector [Legionella pneumophila subsp. pneumophila]
MKSTNNMQKKETDKPTSEQEQKKEVRRNNAPDFIPGASPYYNLYCFFYKLCHGEDT